MKTFFRSILHSPVYASTILFPKHEKTSEKKVQNSSKSSSHPEPLQDIDIDLLKLNVEMYKNLLEACKPLAKKAIEVAEKLNEFANYIRTTEMEFQDRFMGATSSD